MSIAKDLIQSFKSGNMGNFERLAMNIKKGVSGTGSLISDRANLVGTDGRVSLEPGDMVFTDQHGKPLIQTASPVAYDLWYLKHTRNILEQENIESKFISKTTLDDQFSFLSDYLGGLKPLKVIANIEDLVFDPNYDDYWGSNVPWKNDGQYFVHLMMFESWVSGLSEQITSDGAPRKHGFDRNSVCGYLSFPIGQFGVIEVISIIRESEFEADDYDFTDDLIPNTETNSDYFFPPVDNNTGRNICMGDHLIESAYLVPDDVRRNVESLVNPYPVNGDLPYPDISPQMWMKYWIHGDEEKFIPGEFIGIVCKPLALPPHPWWFQETSPLLFAGNWFETSNLTGGVVTEVTLEEDRTDGGIGNLYKVKVHGREIYINSSDFWVYEVDERVGIVKIESAVETPLEKSFTWFDQDRITAGQVDDTIGVDVFQIIPIEFYNN